MEHEVNGTAGLSQGSPTRGGPGALRVVAWRDTGDLWRSRGNLPGTPDAPDRPRRGSAIACCWRSAGLPKGSPARSFVWTWTFPVRWPPVSSWARSPTRSRHPAKEKRMVRTKASAATAPSVPSRVFAAHYSMRSRISARKSRHAELQRYSSSSASLMTSGFATA